MDLFKKSINIRGSFCIERIPRPAGFIIFGASGDLTGRKLMPSLFNLYQKKLLPQKFYIVGCARTTMSDQNFRTKMEGSIRAQFPEADKTLVESFLGHCFYVYGTYDHLQLYTDLKSRLNHLDQNCLPERNHIFYLATPPHVYKKIVEHLGASGLARDRKQSLNEVRVVVEKPFGRDLDTAMELDGILNKALSERQIYRIDHYLGKDTVQNILLFRFANSIFEPIWNRRYIDNVQITVSESIGVEHRAGYFEKAGLLRDMFQNHMLQMLSLVGMEPPISFDADRVRDEKVKLLRSIRPFPVESLQDVIVRGQYGPGTIDGQSVPGYTQEKGVDPYSKTETFVAAKLSIDNWRWQGVPFYLRAGKRMARKASKIVITFKNVPHSMFYPISPADLSPNVLIFHVQPEEGISLVIQSKHPGPKLCMDSLEMVFKYRDVIGETMPEAYERLLLDCMLGDQTLFIRHDDMETSWTLFTPVLKLWEEDGKNSGPMYPYPAGTWGPRVCEELLKTDGRYWLRI
ncbi:MAG: glucose-6-phosphate dehydrogenase [Spirochaetota bacterium]